MPLPTLLQKGSLVANDPRDQPKLDNIVAIDFIAEWFSKRLNLQGIVNRVLVLKSDTGSGKTTAIPPMLYSRFLREKWPQMTIGVTQPRVITAITNAKEVAKVYNELKIGQNVGYSTGSSKRKPAHGILFMTIGTLQTQLKFWTDEEIMAKYKFIILDEVHELSMEMATTLYQLKKFMLRNQNNPLLPFIVCTSATIDEHIYLNYFGVPRDSNFIAVTGFAYAKEEHWMETSPPNFIAACRDNVVKIHMANLNDDPTKSDILVFLPGGGEMEDLDRMLARVNEELIANEKPIFEVIKIDSAGVNSHSRDYIRTFIPANSLKTRLYINGKTVVKQPLRKVILSTSVAETGLTLDTLKYVVDSGYHRGTEFYPTIGADALLTKPASQSRITQRKGRAGRKFPGEFWPAYTREIYGKLPKQQFSELVLGDISSGLLSMMVVEQPIIAGVETPAFKVCQMDLIDDVSTDSLTYALDKCYRLGFYDLAPIKGISSLGRIAEKFTQLRLESIRMILAGYFWGASILDLATIAAYAETSPRDVADKNGINWPAVYKQALPSWFGGEPNITYHKYSVISGGALSGKIAPITDPTVFRIKLLIADDFIDVLFLFRAISNLVAESQNFYSKLIKWCELIGIQYNGLINFLKVRDDIIEQILGMGFVITGTPLLDAPEEEFVNAIARIKYCIRDGFGCNQAVFNGNEYVVGNTPIGVPELLSEAEMNFAAKSKLGIDRKVMPKTIIYDNLMLKYNRRTKLYETKATRVSSLDGW